MGVDRAPRWELQWHPASGGQVRRLILTPRRIRWLGAVAVLVGVVVLALLALLPLGLRAVVTRLSVDSSRRENAALHDEHGALRDRARNEAMRLHTLVERSRRLAWALRLPADVWQPATGEVPDGSDLDTLEAFLRRQGEALERLGVALSAVPVEGDCGPMHLPTVSPVEPHRSVPVAQFGWRLSPFTNKEEAHHGVTLAAPAGEAVLAPGAARVAYAGQPVERRANEWTRFGKVVVLDHGCGVYTVFAHLGEIDTRRGRSVMRGDRIGTVGDSGWTRVPALYYEVRWPLSGDSVPVDPALVDLWLQTGALEALLAQPAGGLPSDYPVLRHLRGIP